MLALSWLSAYHACPNHLFILRSRDGPFSALFTMACLFAPNRAISAWSAALALMIRYYVHRFADQDEFPKTYRCSRPSSLQ